MQTDPSQLRAASGERRRCGGKTENEEREGNGAVDRTRPSLYRGFRFVHFVSSSPLKKIYPLQPVVRYSTTLDPSIPRTRACDGRKETPYLSLSLSFLSILPSRALIDCIDSIPFSHTVETFRNPRLIRIVEGWRKLPPFIPRMRFRPRGFITVKFRLG